MFPGSKKRFKSGRGSAKRKKNQLKEAPVCQVVTTYSNKNHQIKQVVLVKVHHANKERVNTKKMYKNIIVVSVKNDYFYVHLNLFIKKVFIYNYTDRSFVGYC